MTQDDTTRERPAPARHVTCIGGGPGGLYAAILLKRQDPELQVSVYERNAKGVTFGFGVVFSAETLGTLEAADPETFAQIQARFRYWDDIDIHVRGEVVTSTGHGFCGFSRQELLDILHDRATALGVEILYEREIGLDALPPSDLVIAADGVNSGVRDALARELRPHLDWRRNKFVWLGTRRPMEAFTFLFQETEAGLFFAHAYPFAEDLATFIVECREETWRAAGLDEADEATTVARCEEIFADYLQGHALVPNRSIWRTFPTVRLQSWHHGNLVILGDAAYTAHFSIGSGTKLAMESAIALAEAVAAHGLEDVPATLAAYEAERWVEVAKTQKAAQTSLEWFEHADRYIDQDPTIFAFNLLTRSKRITYDNLALRDPGFAARVRARFAELSGTPPDLGGRPPAPVFAPLEVRGLRLENRIVVSPMCQYRAQDGLPDDWHLQHLASRALGGAGLVMTEMTDVSPEARITPGCAGIWNETQAEAWRRIVDFVHAESDAKIGLQLGHAGSKGSTCLPWEGAPDEPLPAGNWPLIAASAIPYKPFSAVPRAMDRADMDAVIEDYVHAARRGARAGFDLLELHYAHGYLLAGFLSPLTNRRRDEYGGSLEGRARFPLELFRAVRAAWPEERPISVRLSAADWVAGGADEEGAQVEALGRLFVEAGCDLLDLSSGQTVPYATPDYGRMYQVPFSDRVRHALGVPTISVGAIQGADHANTVLAAGRADLAALARPHLRDPYLTLHAAEAYGHYDQTWPAPYLTVRPRPPRPDADRRRDGPPLPPEALGEAREVEPA